jgi:uncharacterized protein YdeI (YjbR/CyaY-like superfamily)
MIRNIEDYFAMGCGRCARFATADCSALRWADGLAALRQMCLGLSLQETAKWGHPCYMHAGRNVAIVGAFREDFRLSFFNAALLKDPHKLLEKQGPNTQHPDMLRFRSAPEVLARRAVIEAYLREAMRHAELGLQPVKSAAALVLPEELLAALDADPALAEAFHCLSPGRQKSHVLHIGNAKQSATRHARVAASRPLILAGKGQNER